MLTGQTAFHAESYEGWARHHQTTPPPPPSALRPNLANWQGLDAIVQRLLAKDREDRPKDVAELLGLLDMVQYTAPDARRETVKEDAGKQLDVKRNKSMPVWVWVVSAFVLIVLAFAAVKTFIPKKMGTSAIDLSAGLEPASQPQQLVKVPVSKGSAQKQESDPYASIAKPIELKADDIAPEATPTKQNAGQSASLPPLPEGATLLPPQSGDLHKKKPDFSAIAKQAEALIKQERYAEAKPLLDQACTNDSWEACQNLGNMYLAGYGVSQDVSRAISLYTKACNESSAGCVNLGILYNRGNGVIQDHLKAAMLYSKACDGDSADGCYFLGMMYMIGEGIDNNNERARELFKKGCSMGEEHACAEVEKLK